ncbi:hypothetical protein, partial [Thermogutta sp.]
MNGHRETVKPVTADPALSSVVSPDCGWQGPASKFAEASPHTAAAVASLAEVLSRINECFLRSSSDEVYSEVLDEILRVFKSEYGIL